MDFYSQFDNFVGDIIRSIPEYIVEGQKVKESLKDNINEYKSHFVSCIKGNFLEISDQKEEFFTENAGPGKTDLIKGLDIAPYWSEFSDNTKTTVWKYIQILMLCCHLESKDNKPVSVSADGSETEGNTQNDEKAREIESFVDFMNTQLDPEVIKKMMRNLKEKNAENDKETSGFLNSIMNSKIGGLAKEIAESIGEDDLKETLGISENMKLNNPMDLIGKLTSKDGNSKMMKLMSKIGGAIQSKMKSGDLNHQDLMAEAIGMMSKVKNNPMMASVQSMMNAQMRKSNMAQRLRAKYDRLQKERASVEGGQVEENESITNGPQENVVENADSKPKNKKKNKRRGGKKRKN